MIQLTQLSFSNEKIQSYVYALIYNIISEIDTTSLDDSNYTT